MAGVDLVDGDGRPDPVRAGRVADALATRGVLIGRTGPDASTLKLRPPLVVTEAQLDHLVEQLEAVLRR